MALEANGSADKLAVYIALGEECGLTESLIEMLHGDFWARYNVCFRPFPKVPSTMTRLRNLGVKLGIITNGSIRIQDAKIEALGLREVMDVILISEREGVRKPDREIFCRAVARLGLHPSEAWFVGDNPEVDVAGAEAAGLRAFWRRSEDWPPPTTPCETMLALNDLLPLLADQQ
jgi:putative hydrolase of the HAD superfamily